ncbi:MAG: hypothetical protein R6U40_01440, partial [Desulfobacterales bacterium]
VPESDILALNFFLELTRKGSTRKTVMITIVRILRKEFWPIEDPALRGRVKILYFIHSWHE